MSDPATPPAGTPPASSGTPPAGTPPASSGTPPAGTPPATPPEAPWHGMTDPADVQFITNKGWQNVGDMYRSYRGAEGLIGKDPSTLMTVPRLDDPASVRAVLTKLGLPESADKYEFGYEKDMPIDEGYAKWARSTFHELGLPANIVKTLTAKHGEYIKGVNAQIQKDYELNVESDRAELKKEWGAGYEAQIARTKQAANALGFDNDVIDAIEQVKGFGGTMKFFAELGKKLGEPGFVTPETKQAGFDATMTPDQAKEQWDAMRANKDEVAALSDKFHPGHAAAVAKQTRLFKLMHPEG